MASSAEGITPSTPQKYCVVSLFNKASLTKVLQRQLRYGKTLETFHKKDQIRPSNLMTIKLLSILYIKMSDFIFKVIFSSIIHQEWIAYFKRIANVFKCFTIPKTNFIIFKYVQHHTGFGSKSCEGRRAGPVVCSFIFLHRT